MVGDRVGGGGGAGGGGGISMDDIQGMGFATQSWVNEKYLSIDFFSSLFKAYTSGMVEVMPNGGDVTTIENIKGMFGFWTEQYVSSLGYNSSGGGGGGADLNALLDSINDSSIGDTTPGSGNIGKCLVWTANGWAWGTTGGSGGADLYALLDSINSSTIGSSAPGSANVGKSLVWTSSGWAWGGPAITLTGDVTGSGSGTISTQIATGAVTNAMLAGNIANNKLANSSISIGSISVSLGGTFSPSDLLSVSQSAFDGRYVTIWTQQTVSGEKTFSASLKASNDIYLNKNQQAQWVVFNNNVKNFSFGQESGGNCVLSAAGAVDFYTDINNNPFALYIKGSNGYVGIGTSAPAYKLDVNGVVNTNSAYYLDGKLFADINSGLRIGYGFAAADLPTTIWGDGISFRSIDGTYGECATIGTKYGIMGNDFIGVTNKFRFEYDSTNNTVWVLKADGTAVNFASLGGVTSLGTSSSGTPNISSINVGELTATTGIIDTLNATELKVGGSGASAVKKIYWDGTYLQVQIGTTTYKFRPDATA